MSRSGRSKLTVLLLHACGIMAFLHVYRTEFLGGSGSGKERGGGGGSCSKDNDTCSSSSNVTGAESWGRLVDHLPEALLALELGPSVWWAALVLSVGYALYWGFCTYAALFSPINEIYSKEERDSGYFVSPGRDKKEMANLVYKQRKVGDIPPVYPNGWYEVMRSEDLPVATAKAVSLVGQHLAVFRGESGKVSIVDAYCPHVGANLGVGGRVQGDCIRCPFHGWCFDGHTGQCVDIPYAEKVPSFAKTKVWPSTERNGLILVWFDAEGRDPNFEIDQFEQIKSKRWTYRGRIVHYINTHIEEISANGADLSHFPIVHESGVVAGTMVDYMSSPVANVITHHWEANWEPLPAPNSQKACLKLSVNNRLFGWGLRFLNGYVEALQNGPSIIHLTFSLFLGKGVWIETVVPEGPMSLRMTTYVFADWWIPSFFITGALKGMGVQIERDVHLWTNKTYRSKPMLVKSREDSLIAAHRRWFSQFYSENSPRLSFSNENDLSW